MSFSKSNRSKYRHRQYTIHYKFDKTQGPAAGLLDRHTKVHDKGASNYLSVGGPHFSPLFGQTLCKALGSALGKSREYVCKQTLKPNGGKSII